MAEQEDKMPQPTKHPRLNTNALRIQQISPKEMEWFMGGAFGVLTREVRETFITDTSMKTFYGIVDQKSLYPEMDIKARWHKEDESSNFTTAAGSLINQAKKVETNNLIKAGGILADIVKHVATGTTGAEGLVADITGLRHDIVGPATKKNYGNPEIGNISFDCTYDLRAGQMRLASNMIRTILDMMYPSSGNAYMDEAGYDANGKKAVYNEEGKLKGFVQVVDATKSLFGMIRTINPLPVDVTLGQHFYMAPMVINDVKLTSSPERFSMPSNYLGNYDPRSELMHPTWIKVRIELEPFLMPSPAQSWLVYSGYNMMGPDAGKPYVGPPADKRPAPPPSKPPEPYRGSRVPSQHRPSNYIH